MPLMEVIIVAKGGDLETYFMVSEIFYNRRREKEEVSKKLQRVHKVLRF